MRVLSLLLTVCGGLGVMSCDGPKENPPVLDLSYNPFRDLSMSSVGTPTCVPPGTVVCPSGTFFAASPTQSGCFDDGTTVPDSIMPPYDNPMGTCASVGDIVVQCNPGCSFCLKSAAALPPGCTQQ